MSFAGYTSLSPQYEFLPLAHWSIIFYYFQVTCTGHFTQKFPVSELRHDVEVLIIEPYNACPNQVGICVQQENELTLGPTYQMLRLLKGIY